jgi:hypothetical protein
MLLAERSMRLGEARYRGCSPDTMEMPMRCATILALAIAVSCPTHVQAEDVGPQLKGDEIVKAISDRQINAVNPKGNKWSAVFKSDGSVEYSNGTSGTWRVDGEKFCDHPKGDKEYCSSIFSLGENQYQLMRPDGSKGSILTAE